MLKYRFSEEKSLLMTVYIIRIRTMKQWISLHQRIRGFFLLWCRVRRVFEPLFSRLPSGYRCHPSTLFMMRTITTKRDGLVCAEG